MDKTNIKRGRPMIADELRELFNEIRSDLMLLRTDVTLVNHDLIKIREQLDRIERISVQSTQEPIGLAPGTPPPDFLPPEMM
jgi:hypothetical protein